MVNCIEDFAGANPCRAGQEEGHVVFKMVLMMERCRFYWVPYSNHYEKRSVTYSSCQYHIQDFFYLLAI